MAPRTHDGDELLTRSGLSKMITPSDGHCLLHAVRMSWQQQIIGKAVPTLESLQSAVFQEALCNSGKYKGFFNGAYTDFKSQMMNYLLNKRFNSHFVDLVPLILCNSLNIKMLILDADNAGHYSFVEICPTHKTPTNQTVYVHRNSSHYSALKLSSCSGTNAWRTVSRRGTTTQPAAPTVQTQNRFSCLDDHVEFPPLATPVTSITSSKTVQKKASKNVRKNKLTNKKSPAHTRSNLHEIVTEKPVCKTNVIPENRKQGDVIVIGTSLVRGVATGLNVRGVNTVSYTNAGCTIPHILPRLHNMIPTDFKGTLVLQLAGNDCSQIDAESVILRYELLLKEVSRIAPDCHVILGAIPPRTGNEFTKYRIKCVNDFLHHTCLFSKSYTFMECPLHLSSMYFKKDNVHFNNVGLNLYVSNLHKTLCQVFQMLTAPDLTV